MRLVIWIIFACILIAVSQAANTPAPDTVVNCSTDWECENGPDGE